MLSMYDFTIPVLKKALTNLSIVLKIGEDYTIAKKIDPNILLTDRLFPNMFHLIRQVQVATDMSKGAAAHLGGVEIPKYDDAETSFADLQARITQTIVFLESIKPAQLEGSETREISFRAGSRDLAFNGQDYLLKWVLPNVYFHVTTTYNILRHNGVDLKKIDFLGS